MKFFIAFLALAAVASAIPLNKPIDNFDANLEAIIAAINHPSTDPITAVLLLEQLENLMNISKPPISVGPALVEEEDSPISVGPVIVEEAEHVDAVVSPPPKSPLVQIIVNVSPNVAGYPVVVEQPDIVPTPVIVVEQPELEPEPVIVPTPVIVVEQPEQSPEPVIVAPIVVEPVVVLPDTLN